MTAQKAFLVLIFLAQAPLQPSFAKNVCSPDQSFNSINLQSAASQLGGQVASALSEWQSARESCLSANLGAQKECTEACSSAAQSGINALSLMNLVAPQSGTQNAAAQQEQATTQMNASMQEVEAACSSSRTACESQCQAAISAGEKLVNAATSAAASCSPDRQSVCQSAGSSIKSLVSADNKINARGASVGGKLGQCQQQLKSNLADIMQMLTQLGAMILQAKLAKSDSGSMDPVGEPDCTKPENKPTQFCICKADPRTQGCPNNLEKVGDAGATESLTGAVNPMAAPAAVQPTALGNAEPALAGVGPATDATAAPAAFGGGGGGMGGGGLSAGVDGKPAARSSSLKSNIYSGETGGGGGANAPSFGSGSSSYASGGINRNVSSYSHKSPGYADPAFAPNGSGGGRSNFEKIKTRYGDNTPTLISK